MNRSPFGTATVPVPNSISRLSSRRGFPVVFLALVLGVFALSPTVLAVDPPPDGGYSNENTAAPAGTPAGAGLRSLTGWLAVTMACLTTRVSRVV